MSEAPRKFSRVLKILLAKLRSKGITILGYLDDTLIIADTAEECSQAVTESAVLFDRAGFTVHPEKSVLSPKQEITFLGFIISSLEMTVRLTSDKKEKIMSAAHSILSKSCLSIKQLAEFVGQLVASEPGVPQAALHYKRLEIERDAALKLNNRNYLNTMQLSPIARADVLWWRNNIEFAQRSLLTPQVDCVITSDSSSYAWGGHCEGKFAGGPWTQWVATFTQYF